MFLLLSLLFYFLGLEVDVSGFMVVLCCDLGVCNSVIDSYYYVSKRFDSVMIKNLNM